MWADGEIVCELECNHKVKCIAPHATARNCEVVKKFKWPTDAATNDESLARVMELCVNHPGAGNTREFIRWSHLNKRWLLLDSATDSRIKRVREQLKKEGRIK